MSEISGSRNMYETCRSQHHQIIFFEENTTKLLITKIKMARCISKNQNVRQTKLYLLGKNPITDIEGRVHGLGRDGLRLGQGRTIEKWHGHSCKRRLGVIGAGAHPPRQPVAPAHRCTSTTACRNSGRTRRASSNSTTSTTNQRLPGWSRRRQRAGRGRGCRGRRGGKVAAREPLPCLQEREEGRGVETEGNRRRA